MHIQFYLPIYILMTLCLSCNMYKSNSNTLTKKGVVIKVSDGDSVDFYDGKDTLKIRLQHIDAPERDQAYSRESWQFLRKLIHKQEVVLQHDNTTDRYDRIIGVILINDRNVNKTLIEKGYAWHFKKYSHETVYADLEKTARLQKKGLWLDENPIPPWEWRK